MLELTDLVVQSFEIDHLDIYWKFSPTTEDFGRFSLTVRRSESPGGPFEDVATITDSITFRDVNVNRLHTWRTYYYEIVVKDLRDDDSRTFGPIHLAAKPSLEGLEIARLFKMALRRHTGRKVWVFKRRTSGQRCPGCFDAEMGRRTSSDCLMCFDTGFVGGYWAPIETWGQLDPATKSSQLMQSAETQQQNVHTRFSSFPLLDPRDVIVEAENIRWRVATSTPTERARAVVHQEVTLHRISNSDVEYQLPIRVALPFEASPKSIFTERQSP